MYREKMVIVRLRVDLHKTLKELAKAEGRTIGKQAAELIKRCLNGQA